MKKTFRIIALVLAVAVVAFSLCSCRALDEAKTNQAFYIDSSKEDIIYNETTYRKMETGNLDFIKPWSYSLVDQNKGRFVTEKGVPALLSSWYGDSYELYHDNMILSIFDQDFVREDQYDHIKEILFNTNLDHYVLSYWSYPDYDDFSTDSDQENVLLDDETTEAIQRTLNTSLKDRVKYDTVDYVDLIRVNACDADLFFANYMKTTYIIKDYFDYYLWDGNSNEKLICPVSKDDVKLFRTFFDTYPSAVVSENLSWYFEDNYEYYNSSPDSSSVDRSIEFI